MTGDTTVPRPSSLPRPIRCVLARVDRRLRLKRLLRSFGILAVVMGVGAALGMAADVAVVLPIAVRWLLWAVWVGTVGLILLGLVLVPLLRAARWAELAAVAERPHPELGERLTSAVGLVTGPVPAHGSPELVAALLDEASARVRVVDPRRAVPLRRAGYWVIAGAVTLLLMTVPIGLRPDPFRDLWARFLTPWADVDRVGRYVVTVEPGDRIVAVGEDLIVRATARPRFGRTPPPAGAFLEWADFRGKRHRVPMSVEPASGVTTETATRAFQTTVTRLTGSIRYRVEAGSSPSRWFAVQAVAPPTIASLRATIEPPAYTNLPVALAGDRLDVWEGSRVTLTVTPSKPLRAVQVMWPSESGGPRPVSLEPEADGKTWSATLTASNSGSYAWVLWDKHGLTNRPEAPRRLVVRPDAPPTIALLGPDTLKECRPDDLLPVEIAARDDLGVATIELHYEVRRAGSEAPPLAGKLEVKGIPTGVPVVQTEASLNLRTLSMQPGDVVAYRARALDTRPPPRGPNEGWSDVRELSIVAEAESLVARRARESRTALQAQLDALKQAAAENRQATEQLRYAADAAQRTGGVWDETRHRELTAREAAARDVVDRLQVLARDLEADRRFAPLADPTRLVAEVEADAGREALAEARLANDPTRRLADLQKADSRLGATQARIADLQRQFDALARVDLERQRLDDLARRQEDLATRAETLANDPAGSGGDRARLDQMQAEQDQLGRALDELMRQSPVLRAEAQAERAREADELARQVRDLAARQREEARQTADPPRDDPRFLALAEAQKAIEAEARRLALDIDPPLADNSRGRLHLDPLAQAADPLARGAVELARRRLEEAEDELRRLARDIGDVADDPRALARRLAQRQNTLARRVTEALRDVHQPAASSERQAELGLRLAPLLPSQDAVNRLLGAIQVPDAQIAIDLARQQTARAGEALQGELDPRQVEARQREAAQALQRLANALPDPNRRRDATRQKAAEARSRISEVARGIEQALRETGPRPGKPHDSQQANLDLARKLEPLVRPQAEALEAFEMMAVDSEIEPQLTRALNRARLLDQAMRVLRDNGRSPKETEPTTRSVRSWHVLGPVPSGFPRPFPVHDASIDLHARYPKPNGGRLRWRPVTAAPQGMLNLGKLYAGAEDQDAFAFAEVISPTAGKGQLVLGSDDTLRVWLNGKPVYQYAGSRAYVAGQDTVEVEWREGPNRLIARCGNRTGPWVFGIATVLPLRLDLAGAQERARRAQAVREVLPLLSIEAQAASERLEQKLRGGVPADETADEIAADHRLAARRPLDPEGRTVAAAEHRRLANALRNLSAPDAPVLKAEAIRLAEQAAQALAQPDLPPAEARATANRAADASRALAQRLADRLSPTVEAAALAQAERALDAEVRDPGIDPVALAQRQRAIADAALRLPRQTPQAQLATQRADQAADLADRAANLITEGPEPTAGALAAARVQAAEALEALASLPPVPAGDVLAEADLSPRARVEALARRQRDLAEQARAVADRAARDPDPASRDQAADDLAALADDQRRLEAAIAELPEDRPPDDLARREADQHRLDAMRTQRQTAFLLAQRDAPRAVTKAREAATALARLARVLPGAEGTLPPLPKDPELNLDPAFAEQALALARRERRLREGLQALLGERAATQEQLRDQAGALGHELARLRDQTREAGPRAHGPAQAAADLLSRQAPQAMRQGAESLALGRPDPARDAQRQAADLTEQAASRVEDLAAALRADAPPQSTLARQAETRQGLAQAQDAQRQAVQHLAQSRDAALVQRAAGDAASSMHQAAEAMRSAARLSAPASRAQAGTAAAPSPKAVDPQGGPVAVGEAELAQLRAVLRAKTGRAWGELPGHLRTEILQMSQGRYRDDYARLIQLYFQEIATASPDRRTTP